MPSLAEGVPIAIMDAFVHGRPVISTNVGGNGSGGSSIGAGGYSGSGGDGGAGVYLQTAGSSLNVLFGSITARPTNLLIVLPFGFVGNDPLVMLTIVEEPVDVAHTWPFCKPTMR